jgi:hypothetical protein
MEIHMEILEVMIKEFLATATSTTGMKTDLSPFALRQISQETSDDRNFAVDMSSGSRQ